jgi:hypothetical protein
MGVMNEIPEQLGLKGKHSIVVRWGKNDVEKLFRRPKVVLCSNLKLCHYVTVVNCSLIRGGEVVCRRPDSLVSKAAVRYSEGPRFESRSGFTLKKNIYKYFF